MLSTSHACHLYTQQLSCSKMAEQLYSVVLGFFVLFSVMLFYLGPGEIVIFLPHNTAFSSQDM
jgi:hypothetical protein